CGTPRWFRQLAVDWCRGVLPWPSAGQEVPSGGSALEEGLMILNDRLMSTRPHLSSALALALCLGLALSATKAEAAYSPNKTPAKAVPAGRGGGVIQPEAILGDDTRYNDAIGDPKKDNQFWFAVDIETSSQGTYLFSA